MPEGNLQVVYIRRMISGDDPAFNQENLDWNTERLAHFNECLGLALQVLPVGKFVEFHNIHVVEFNALGAELNSATMQHHLWFNLDGAQDKCKSLLEQVREMISIILTFCPGS